MPKRPVAAPVVEAEENEEVEIIAESKVKFTEEELKNIDTKVLQTVAEQLFDDLGEGKNTNSKMRKLILKYQEDHGDLPIEAGQMLLGAESPQKQSPSATLEALAPAGSVRYDLGFTKNLGNYQSLKINVGITLPLEPTDDDIAKAHKAIAISKQIVEKELLDELAEVNAKFGGQA